MFSQPPSELPALGLGAHDSLGSAASVSLQASTGDTLEVFHALALPHSFPDKTCRCRPGKRADAWPRAREPLPTCWDLLKVCVSNACWPSGLGVLGGLQAGSCTGQGKVGPGIPLPLALPMEKTLRLLGRGLPSGREKGGMLPFLGSPRWAEPGGYWGRSAPMGEPQFLRALGQLRPKQQSPPIKLSSRQP